MYVIDKILIEKKKFFFSSFVSGLILSDLTFVHIGNSDYLQDDRIINFWKRWQQFTILHKLRYCRKWFVLEVIMRLFFFIDLLF